MKDSQEWKEKYSRVLERFWRRKPRLNINTLTEDEMKKEIHYLRHSSLQLWKSNINYVEKVYTLTREYENLKIMFDKLQASHNKRIEWQGRNKGWRYKNDKG